jgi:hypothetical protein
VIDIVLTSTTAFVLALLLAVGPRPRQSPNV